MSDAVFPYCITRAPVQENFRNGRGARFGLARSYRTHGTYGTHRTAFTLIELLVVIAIISILAAILFPVFGKAKSNAQQTSCLANLKQLAAAWQAYADDSAGRACISYYYSANYEYAWDVVLDSSESPPASKLGLLGPYTRSGKINQCPSFKEEPSGRPFTGYAYNATYIGGDINAGKPPCLLNEIARPTQTALLADAGWGNPVRSEAYLRAPSETLLFTAGKVHFRHSGWANVAYADCHVRATNKICRRDSTEPECGALSEDDSAYDLK